MLTDDLLITPALLERFEGEAFLEGGNGQFYAFIRTGDGKLIAHHPGSPQIIAEQTMWAADVLHRLNKDLHHDGAWALVFTAPLRPLQGEAIFAHPDHIEYGRYVLIWLDQDGDPQFSVEWVQNESELLDFSDVLLAGIDSTVDKMEGAWQMWNLHMRDVIEPAEGQTFKRARGQRAASASRH